MVVKNTCTAAKVPTTGPSHLPEMRMSTLPNTTFQKVHSKKLPSCPSQKHERMNCHGMVLFMCSET